MNIFQNYKYFKYRPIFVIKYFQQQTCIVLINKRNLSFKIQITQPMPKGGRKKYQSKSNHHESARNTKISQQQQQALIQQCYSIFPLLDENKKVLKQSDRGYIISKKWLTAWKTYVGYDYVVKQQQEQGIPKSVGSKHPGKINQGMLKSDMNYLKIPKQMQEYDYLNIILNNKLDKEDDYTCISKPLWQAFSSRYQVLAEIERPIRKTKYQYFYDDVLFSCDVVFLNYQEVQEHLNKHGKITNKQLDNVLPNYKMQVPTIWSIDHLYQFVTQYMNYEYGNVKGIKIWRCLNFLSLAEIQQQIRKSVESQQYLLSGVPITNEKYKDLDIDDFLKAQYTLVIQIGEEKLKKKEPVDKIKGYCEQCVKSKVLEIFCQCKQVYYCSEQCRIVDQAFHYNSCENAFDSDDDEDYNKKIIKEPSIGNGVKNIGNTCYMNSSFQSLLSIQEIRRTFINNSYLSLMPQDKKKQPFLKKFSKFCKYLFQDEDQIVNPWSIKGQINYNLAQFKGFKQHDANDFIMNLITLINENFNHQDDKMYAPLFDNNFIGIYDSKIQCPDCHIEIKCQQIFLHIALPIKSKAKKQFYNYVIMKKNSIKKGRAQVLNSWKDIKNNLNINDACQIYAARECESLFYVDQQVQPSKQIKSLKREIIAYPDVVVNQGEIAISVNTIGVKYISGMQMKSVYGYPYLLKVDPRITTIIAFWCYILRQFQYEQVAKKLQAQEQQYQKLYFECIERYQAIKKQIKEELQTEVKEEGQNIQLALLTTQTNAKLKNILKQERISILTEDIKKIKNKCAFCQKKCNGCSMDIMVNKSVQDYFGTKITQQQVTFQIRLTERYEQIVQTVDLAKTGDSTIQDCFQLFKQPQQLDQENAWYCQICDMMRLAHKHLTIKLYPNILILQLNRFKNENNGKVKNNDPIDYEDIETFGGHAYKLLSVIIHEGGMEFGHYWAICWRKDKYYIFNDEKVHQTDKFYHKNAYILVYRKMQ